MKTLTAVLVETGKPLELVELEIPSLKPGQVLVEIHYSAVCHTQILEWKGYRGVDKFLPHCLGHEGSGRVHEIGPEVKKVKPGDRVILSWMKGLGGDVPSTVYRWGMRLVHSGAITTFGRYSVLSENRLTVMNDPIPMNQAALLGCAIPTGVGTVWNTLAARPGQSIVIFGAGGIGLCAVAGASVSGCFPVVAVDIREEKLEMAKKMGATHTILVSSKNPVTEILALCPGGTDFAVEATGQPQVMVQAIESVRSQGGSAVIIGNAKFGEKAMLDPWQLNLGKKVLGTWGGENVPDRDFPRYCKMVSSEKIDLHPILSKPYDLEQINQALTDLESGRTSRPLIDMGHQP